MAENGVFAVARNIFDHPLFKREPFTEREAWIWLIKEAAWRPCRVRVRNGTVDLERGQLAYATRFLAERWQWSEARVRRFLARLQTDAMIDAQTDARVTRITICKYDEYQKVSLPTDAHESEQPTRKRRASDAKKNTGNISSSLRSEDAPAEMTILDRLWIDGKATLVSLGASERQAGSMIGRWLRDCGDDAQRVLGAIQRARDHGTGDPIPFVTRLLNPSNGHGTDRKSPKRTVHDVGDDLIREAEERARDESASFP